MDNIPKSSKLSAEESTHSSQSTISDSMTLGKQDEEVQIREIRCCNDFVAILQSQIETSIALANEDSSYKNEGLVVGVGPGISDGAGSRLKPTVEVGDVVLFGRAGVTEIDSDSPPYKGKKVIITSDRNIMCILNKKIPYKKYEG